MVNSMAYHMLMYNGSLKEHVIHLRLVMEFLVKHQLFANRKKYSFGQQMVDYLGHIISAEEVETYFEKTNAISNGPVPKIVKLKSFFGPHILL